MLFSLLNFCFNFELIKQQKNTLYSTQKKKNQNKTTLLHEEDEKVVLIKVERQSKRKSEKLKYYFATPISPKTEYPKRDVLMISRRGAQNASSNSSPDSIFIITRKQRDGFQSIAHCYKIWIEYESESFEFSNIILLTEELVSP